VIPFTGNLFVFAAFTAVIFGGFAVLAFIAEQMEKREEKRR
jgi:hypothetical protein